MKSQANGCGPSGVVGKIIPDSLLGVSVHEACNLHDDLYTKGGSDEERKEADEIFLKTMLDQVNQQSKNKIAKASRKLGAYLYYYSVRFFGRFFFGKS